MEFVFKKNTLTENSLSGETSYKRTITLNYSDPSSSVRMDIGLSGNDQEVMKFLIENFKVSKVNDRCEGEFKLVARQTTIKDHLSETDIDIDSEGVSDLETEPQDAIIDE